jgi:hypothetical protein
MHQPLKFTKTMVPASEQWSHPTYICIFNGTEERRHTDCHRRNRLLSDWNRTSIYCCILFSAPFCSGCSLCGIMDHPFSPWRSYSVVDMGFDSLSLYDAAQNSSGVSRVQRSFPHRMGADTRLKSPYRLAHQVGL